MNKISLYAVVAMCLLIGCSKDDPGSPSLGSITGRALDERTMQPMASVQISSIPASVTIITDANGAYSIPNVVPGMYVINGKYGDSASGQATANVIAGLTAQADIVMEFGLAPNIPTDELVAYYPLNGSAVDVSTNGFSGTVVGATFTSDRHGNPGRALLTDGDITDGAIVEHREAMNVLPLTLSAWIRIDDPFMRDGLILGKNIHPDGDGYYLMIEDRELIFVYINDFFTQGYRVDIDVPAGDWMHVAMTVTGSSAYAYVDGAQFTMQRFGSGAKRVTTPGQFRMGSHQVSDGRVGFEGAIDDVFIYSRVLSSTEIDALKDVSN